jgi:DNA primase
MGNTKDKLFSYFKSQQGAFEYRNGWMRVPICPFCGREDKLGVHLGKSRAHCFRCDYDEKPLKAVMDIENLKSEKDALLFLRNFEGDEYIEPRYEKVEERQVILPDGFKTLRRGDGTIGNMARAYVTNRGFDYKELSRRGVGYTDDGESKYFGYLIVPFHKNREVVYFQTRRFFGVGPKFNNPMYEDFGIGKNQIIYNSDALKRYREISVVESWTNAWSLSKNTVSLNGKTLSGKQLQLLLQSKAKLINILLDRDAWEYALKMAFELITYKNVRVIKFRDDRDVNDLGQAVTMKMIDNTPIIKTFRELMKLKHEGNNI